MTHPNGFNLIVIGDRINPGFKSVKTLIENDDLAGIQAMAVKQVESGASYLDVTIGPRAINDPDFMAKTIRAIQQVVSVPLSIRARAPGSTRARAPGSTRAKAPAAQQATARPGAEVLHR